MKNVGKLRRKHFYIKLPTESPAETISSRTYCFHPSSKLVILNEVRYRTKYNLKILVGTSDIRKILQNLHSSLSSSF